MKVATVNLFTNMCIFSSCLLLRSHRSSKYYRIFAFGFGYHQEFDGKTLLLKIAHTWVTRHRKINLGSTWKLHPHLVAFIVMLGKKHNQQSYIGMNSVSYSNNWPGKISPRCNNGMNLIGVSHPFLIGLKAFSVQQNSCVALLIGSKTRS